MVIFTARITIGREKIVMDSLEAKVKANKLGIKAILAPAELKGYIFIEGNNIDEVRKLVTGVPHVRGLIEKEVKIEDIENFLEAKAPEIKIKEGDIVEIIGGPFKREKAKVIKVDEEKREAKIELIDSAVPIPITIKADLLKVIKEE